MSSTARPFPVDDPNRAFARFANPHSWLLSANNLHEQALQLRHQRGRSLTTRVDHDCGAQATSDDVDKPVFLLGGFALENAIKAFLVFENPSYISNGTLARPLHSHALADLARQAYRIPYRNRYVWVLRELENGINSWARYPCGHSINETSGQSVLHDKLWAGYLRLINAYGYRMRVLLAQGWKGPHGIEWTFDVGAAFLAMDSSRRIRARR